MLVLSSPQSFNRRRSPRGRFVLRVIAIVLFEMLRHLYEEVTGG